MQSSSEASRDFVSRADMPVSIRKLARLGILVTLVLSGLLLLADLALARQDAARFLSADVLIAIVIGIALMVAAAIGAMTCLALWKQ